MRRTHREDFSLSLRTRRHPSPTLFPYTTLFRSLSPLPSADPAVREQLNEEARQHGWEILRLWHATDRKSTRLNSSHVEISYAVFCLKKKTTSICAPGRRRSRWAQIPCAPSAWPN